MQYFGKLIGSEDGFMTVPTVCSGRPGSTVDRKMMRKRDATNILLMLVMATSLLLSGCSLFKKDKEEVDATAEELYAKAQESLADKNWTTAVEQLRKLEAQYPYGKYAEQAQMDTVYAYYKNEEPGLALAAADRFIKLHPTHPSVDYAYYLKGMASYEEDDSFFGRLTGQDDLSDRDASLTLKAMNAFTDVYTLFPDSRYAPDSRARVRYLRNALARHEIAVAKYYYSRGAYVAVVNRAKGIIEEYPKTTSIEEALAMMMFSYQKMGLEDLASDARRVLALNYPESAFLDETVESARFRNDIVNRKEKKPGWFSTTTGKIRQKLSDIF